MTGYSAKATRTRKTRAGELGSFTLAKETFSNVSQLDARRKRRGGAYSKAAVIGRDFSFFPMRDFFLGAVGRALTRGAPSKSVLLPTQRVGC